MSPMGDENMISKVIGIPRALCYFLYPGLWEAFFRALGLTVIVSESTTRATVERAGLISESEHCLPVKMLDAHLAELVEKVDTVFVPRIFSTLAGHIACPKLGALPDCALAQFGDQVQVLTIDINEDKMSLEKSLAALGRQLGRDWRTIKAAVEISLNVMQKAREKENSSTDSKGRRYLILGHPYNLHDNYMSGPILKKLEELNVCCELVQYDVAKVDSGPIKWDACGIMYDRLQSLTPDTCAGVIQLSSFNCGCDSIVSEIFRAVLKDKGIPYMTLILDEHSAQAGVDTRLEAFVDSIGW